MSHERLFTENRRVIEDVIGSICRRKCLGATEADDFRSVACEKLVENDYEALRRHRGPGSFRSYLTVVLLRALLDHRNHEWGKWRPSVEATRLGDVAKLLERLTVRDGRTFAEAVEELRTNHGVTESRDVLWAMAERLPVRQVRKPVNEDVLVLVSDPGPPPDAALEGREAQAAFDRTRQALEQAMETLDDQDRLIVKLHFYDGLKIVDIARELGLAQKPMYRRVEQMLLRLRRVIEEKQGPSIACVRVEQG